MSPRLIPPAHSESMRFVAQASRPGSIEARHIHSCTCSQDLDRAFTWNQERVWEWQGSISLDCPAHGRLLEQHLAQVNASMQHAQHLTMDALDPGMGMGSLPPPPAYPPQYLMFEELGAATKPRRRTRSLPQRVVDALQGLVRGWRGA